MDSAGVETLGNLSCSLCSSHQVITGTEDLDEQSLALKFPTGIWLVSGLSFVDILYVLFLYDSVY